MLHGRDLILSINGVAVAGAKSCEVSVSSGSTEVSSPTDGQWRHYIADRKEWSVTCGVLFVDDSQTHPLTDPKAMVGTEVTLRTAMRDGSDYLQGSAIVTAWRVTGTVGNLMQGTFSFRGNGSLN